MAGRSPDGEAFPVLGRAMGLLAGHRNYFADDLAAEMALGPDGLAPFEDMLRPVPVEALTV